MLVSVSLLGFKENIEEFLGFCLFPFELITTSRLSLVLAVLILQGDVFWALEQPLVYNQDITEERALTTCLGTKVISLAVTMVVSVTTNALTCDQTFSDYREQFLLILIVRIPTFLTFSIVGVMTYYLGKIRRKIIKADQAIQIGNVGNPVAPKNEDPVVASRNENLVVAPTKKVPAVELINKDLVALPRNEEPSVSKTNKYSVIVPTNEDTVAEPLNEDTLVASTDQDIVVAPTFQDQVVAPTDQDQVVAHTDQDQVVAPTIHDQVTAPTNEDQVETAEILMDVKRLDNESSDMFYRVPRIAWSSSRQPEEAIEASLRGFYSVNIDLSEKLKVIQSGLRVNSYLILWVLILVSNGILNWVYSEEAFNSYPMRAFRFMSISSMPTLVLYRVKFHNGL